MSTQIIKKIILPLLSLIIVGCGGGSSGGSSSGSPDEDDPIPADFEVELEYPRPMEEVSGMVRVNAWTTEWNGLDSVELYVDGELANSDTNEPFAFLWDTQLNNNGEVTLRVVAVSNDEEVAEDSFAVTINNPVIVDDQAPVITLSSPSENSELDEIVFVSSSITDSDGSNPPSSNNVDYVEVLVNDEVVETLLSTPWRSFIDTRELTNGTIDIAFVAYDHNRNQTRADFTGLTINNPNTSAVCGDDILSLGEECEDANTLSGDTCSSTCTWELDNFEEDNNYRDARSIAIEQSIVEHTISGAGDIDYFTFSVTEAERTVIETTGVDDFCNTDTVITLFEEDGLTIIESNDEGGREIPCSQIVRNPLEAGTYYLNVRHYNETQSGAYALRILQVEDDRFEGNDTLENAVSLGSTPISVGSLVDVGDEDWFSFPAEAGSNYTVSIVDADCKADDRSALNLTAYRADGVTVLGAEREISQIPRICATFDFTAPAAETIYILVSQRNEVLWGETYGISVVENM